MIVGPGDVGRTFRVTRDMDPFDFDAAVQQLTNAQPNSITFQVVPNPYSGGFFLEQPVTEAALFPPFGDFSGQMITAMTLRLDGLTLTNLSFATQVNATLTLAVEGTSPGAGLSLSEASLPESVPVGALFAHILTVRNDFCSRASRHQHEPQLTIPAMHFAGPSSVVPFDISQDNPSSVNSDRHVTGQRGQARNNN